MQLPFATGDALDPGRAALMGILNVTPDSFSDGGKFANVEDAVRHAQTMVAEGAAIIDVGGESTRPGSERVPAAEQIRRTRDVIAALAEARRVDRAMSSVRISIDTTLTEVAVAAIDAGADLINDISAGRDDPGMFDLAAKTGTPIVLMHMQGRPRTMQEAPQYENVVAEVAAFLVGRAEAAQQAGVAAEKIIIDPGIGFGKTFEHNLALLKGLDRLVATGYPVLLGASRKRFLRTICEAEGRPADNAALAAATAATTIMGMAAGVLLFRVHDVRANRLAIESTLEGQPGTRRQSPRAVENAGD